MSFVDERDCDLVEARDLIMARGLTSPDPAARYAAAFVPIGGLFECPEAPLGMKVLPLKAGLAAALCDPNREVRGLAAWYLSELGPGAVEFVPQMLENLALPRAKTISLHLIDMTPHAVARIAEQSDDAWRLFLDASRSSNASLRLQCALAFSTRALASRGATHRLLEMLHDPAIGVVNSAAYSLGLSVPESAEALAAVVDCIERRAPGEKPTDALFRFGDAVIPYLPRLVPLLHVGDADERRTVLFVLTDLQKEHKADLHFALVDLRRVVESGTQDDINGAQKLIDAIEQKDGSDTGP